VSDHVGHTDPVVFKAPSAALEIGLEDEYRETHDPGHRRKQDRQDCHFTEYVFVAIDGPAEIEREGVVREIGGDQTRRHDDRDQEGRERLPGEEDHEKLVGQDVHQVGRHPELLEQGEVVAQIDEENADNRWQEAECVKGGEEP